MKMTTTRVYMNGKSSAGQVLLTSTAFGSRRQPNQVQEGKQQQERESFCGALRKCRWDDQRIFIAMSMICLFFVQFPLIVIKVLSEMQVFSIEMDWLVCLIPSYVISAFFAIFFTVKYCHKGEEYTKSIYPCCPSLTSMGLGATIFYGLLFAFLMFGFGLKFEFPIIIFVLAVAGCCFLPPLSFMIYLACKNKGCCKCRRSTPYTLIRARPHSLLAA